jgi:hypothetical protein
MSTRASSFLRYGETSWALHLDTSELILGKTYAFCADWDGSGTDFSVGDTGNRVYVSGVVGFAGASTIFRGAKQPLYLSCVADGCTTDMTAVLATDCDTSFIGVDLHAMPGVRTHPPAHIEVDGGEEVEGKGAALATTSQGRSDRFQEAKATYIEPKHTRFVKVYCPTCTTSSTGYIGLRCETSATNGVMYPNADRTTASLATTGAAPTSHWQALMPEASQLGDCTGFASTWMDQGPKTAGKNTARCW